MSNQSVNTEIGASHELRNTAQTVTACFFLVLTMIVALVGNIGVILVVMLYRQMKKDISNMLLVNLSITDLANTCLVMLTALIGLIADDWILGSIWCDVICAVNYCLIIVSMLTLCCISLDRYQAVIHSLTYQSRVKRKTLLLAIVYSWFQGAVFSLVPPVLGWVDYDYWEAICAIQWHLYRPGTIIYVVSAFTLCFLGPGIILCYCYVKIIKEVKQQADHITLPAANGNKPSKRKMSDKARIIWSLLVVVFAYFTCTAPFSVTKLIKVFVSDTSIIPGSINLSSALLGYMASAINPLIYGIFRKDFQRAYIQIIKMIFLGQRRTSTLGSCLDMSTRARHTKTYYSSDDRLNRTVDTNGCQTNNTENTNEDHPEEINIEQNGEILQKGAVLESNGNKNGEIKTESIPVNQFKEDRKKSSQELNNQLSINLDKVKDNDIETNGSSVTKNHEQQGMNGTNPEQSNINFVNPEQSNINGSNIEQSSMNRDQTVHSSKPNGYTQICTIANSIDSKIDEINLDEIDTVANMNHINTSHRPESSDSNQSVTTIKVVTINIDEEKISEHCNKINEVSASSEVNESNGTIINTD